MSKTYSVYEAKAKLSEIIRHVRAGERVTISYRGEEVAEIRPVGKKETFEERLRRLEEQGIIEPAKSPKGRWRPLVDHEIPGALQRFLDERE